MRRLGAVCGVAWAKGDWDWCESVAGVLNAERFGVVVVVVAEA